MARRWTLEGNVARGWTINVAGPPLDVGECVEVIEAPAGEPDPERVERVADAIREAMQTYTDEATNIFEWLARAAIRAYEEGKG